LLKQDHKTVNALFKRFEKLGDGAASTKREVADQIVRELSVHAAIEELVFYPAVKGISDDLKNYVLESLEEHHVVKWLCSEIDGMSPENERFDAKVTVLIENVRHHVEEEEEEFFPKVREELGRKTLAELGDLLAEAKKTAPTRPHPKAPDEPPGNAIAGMVAGLIDRARDAGMDALKQAGRRSSGTRRAATPRTRSASSRSRTATKAAARAKQGVQTTRTQATTARAKATGRQR
jgi:hemerythrin superfamily protein